MIDVEDRMPAKGEVLHTLVGLGALQRTEEHEAEAEDTEQGENEDNQLAGGKETRRGDLLSTIADGTEREITRRRHRSIREE